ncbi:MAG: hypothetical protein ACYCPS_06770, partial [Candidatus Saccharimonadales bacterium]
LEPTTYFEINDSANPILAVVHAAATSQDISSRQNPLHIQRRAEGGRFPYRLYTVETFEAKCCSALHGFGQAEQLIEQLERGQIVSAIPGISAATAKQLPEAEDGEKLRVPAESPSQLAVGIDDRAPSILKLLQAQKVVAPDFMCRRVAARDRLPSCATTMTQVRSWMVISSCMSNLGYKKRDTT